MADSDNTQEENEADPLTFGELLKNTQTDDKQDFPDDHRSIVFDEDTEKPKRKRSKRKTHYNSRTRIALLLLLIILIGFGFLIAFFKQDSSFPGSIAVVVPTGVDFSNAPEGIFPSPDKHITIIKDNTPLYANPDPAAQVIEYMPRGTVKIVLASKMDVKHNQWYYVKDGYGWFKMVDSGVYTLYDDIWFEDNIPQMTRQIELNPNEAKAYLDRGWAYFNWGSYELAIDDLSTAIRLEPNNPQLYDYRGKIHLDAKNYQLALEDFNQAIEMGLNEAATYNRRAIARHSLNDLSGALADYQLALELNPDYGLIYNNMGALLQMRGQSNEAISLYNRAIEADPNLTLPYTNLGNVARDQMDLSETTLNYYLHAQQLDSTDMNNYLNRGVYYLMKKDYSLAIADFDAVIAVDIENVKAYSNRGGIYAQLGFYEQAFSDLEKAVELAPNFADAHYNLGWAYSAVGEYENAIREYDRTLELNPNFRYASINRANALENLNKTKP